MRTPTTRRILAMLAQGYSVSGVANKLHVTVQDIFDARASLRRRRPTAFPELTEFEIQQRAKAVKQESLSQTRDKQSRDKT